MLRWSIPLVLVLALLLGILIGTDARDAARTAAPAAGATRTPPALAATAPAGTSGAAAPTAPTAAVIGEPGGPGGGPPLALAAGEGAVWAVDAAGQVLRFDPATGGVVATVPVPGARALAVGAGAVWVLGVHPGTFAQRAPEESMRCSFNTCEPRGAVTRIDPTTNGVARVIPVGLGADSLTVAFGSVWVPDNGRPGGEPALLRVDPAAGRVAGSVRLGPAGSLGPAPGVTAAAGALWVAAQPCRLDPAEAQPCNFSAPRYPVLLRVDPTAEAVAAVIPLGGGLDHWSLAVLGGQDEVWTVERGEWPAPSWLRRIDPATNAVVAAIPYEDPPTVVYAGGSPWLLDCAAGTLTELDATGAAASEPLRFAAGPAGTCAVTAADGMLWVAGAGPAGVVSVELPAAREQPPAAAVGAKPPSGLPSTPDAGGTTGAGGATPVALSGEIETVLTALSCPDSPGPDGIATEFLAGAAAGDLEARGCRRAAAGDTLLALLAVGQEGTEPREVAWGWTDDNGEVTLRGAAVPDAEGYLIEEQDFAWGTSGRSELLTGPLAASYAVVNHDERGHADLTLRALTCPAGTADPVAACRANRVDRRVWDEFDVRPSEGGGFSEAEPDLVHVDVQPGPVTIAVRPAVFNQYAGAHVSCVDEATGVVLFAGQAADPGLVSLRLPAGSRIACEWYHLTPADGGTPVAPPAPPVPASAASVDAPGVWVIGADGSGLTNLTPGEPTAAAPVWSPDGRRIAYLTGGEGARTLNLIEADGSGRRRIADPPLADVAPGWSPDGRQVLVVAADGAIHATAADGSGTTALTGPIDLGPNAEGYVRDVGRPAWSPAGDAIVYPAAAPDGEGMELYLMGADGSNPAPLTDLPADSLAFYPSWSPDGGRVGIPLTREDNGFCAAVVVDVAGTRPRQVGGCGAVAWSPDGTRVLVDVYLGDGASQIDLASADGAWAVALTGEGGYIAPAWSPDGQRIAYLGEGGVSVMNADGSGAVALATGAGGGLGVSSVGWSPDGRRLVFAAASWSGGGGD